MNSEIVKISHFLRQRMSGDTWRAMCYNAWKRPMNLGHMTCHVSTCMAHGEGYIWGVGAVRRNRECDTPIPGVPLTNRQPSEYSWMSSNLTPQHRVPFSGTHDLTKIRHSLLCMGSSTQNTTCAITWQHDPILYNDHTGSTYE